MSTGTIAWFTHAPADYMLVFRMDRDGEHAVASARFDDPELVRAATAAAEANSIDEDGMGLCAYCTVPGEADSVVAGYRDAGASETWIERGTVAFVAVGDGSTTDREAAGRRRDVAARVVVSEGGAGPRCYRLAKQCAVCGEFLGTIDVMPQGPMLLDTRELACRCTSIPCRYCDAGWVRRPLTEHLDPERRAGSVPWFGYLVPCGGCQVAGRGPRVQMST